VLAEQLAASGKKEEAQRLYRRLQETRTADNEQHIREAAKRGLAMIG
jgi:hypothetical protein